MKGKNIEEIVEAASKLTGSAEKSEKSKLVQDNRAATLYYRVVKNKTEVYDIISRSFSRTPGWSELPHGMDLRNSWNLMWSWSKITIDLSRLLVF